MLKKIIKTHRLFNKRKELKECLLGFLSGGVAHFLRPAATREVTSAQRRCERAGTGAGARVLLWPRAEERQDGGPALGGDDALQAAQGQAEGRGQNQRQRQGLAGREHDG